MRGRRLSCSGIVVDSLSNPIERWVGILMLKPMKKVLLVVTRFFLFEISQKRIATGFGLAPGTAADSE